MHTISPELLARHDYKIPHYIAGSVGAIDFKLLASRGLTNILIDVDNTLVSYGQTVIHTRVAPVLAAARADGFIDRLAIASNSRRNLDHIVRTLAPDAVIQPRGMVMKPRRRYFEQALQELGSTPGTTVMIGDKLIQDVWGARRAGLTTVLVKPLGRDLWLDRLLYLRLQERWLLRRYLPHHPEHWF